MRPRGFPGLEGWDSQASGCPSRVSTGERSQVRCWGRETPGRSQQCPVSKWGWGRRRGCVDGAPGLSSYSGRAGRGPPSGQYVGSSRSRQGLGQNPGVRREPIWGLGVGEAPRESRQREGKWNPVSTAPRPAGGVGEHRKEERSSWLTIRVPRVPN